MDFRKTLILVFVCSMIVGCRRDPYVDAYFDMLNAEKRVLEDRLFEAEYNYEKALRELQACRTKPTPSRSRDSRDDDERRVPPIETPDLPEVEFPPGFPTTTGSQSNNRFRPVGTGVLPVASNSLRGEETERSESLVRPDASPPLDQRVTAIHLNVRRTGGIELDGAPGDDGIAVLIEPRNAQGQFVARPAALSIVLLDPLKRGEEARFARWDFDRETAQRMMRAQGLDRGLDVRVPWPDVPPSVDRLHLFVRYTTDDDRTLETDREILVRPAGLIADRWTPRAENSVSRIADRLPAAPMRPQDVDESRVIQASHEGPTPETPVGNSGRETNSSTAPSNAKRERWSPMR